MELLSKHNRGQNRGAVLTLFVTILLLIITGSILYYDYPNTKVAESDLRVHFSAPSNQQNLNATRAAAILETRPLENLVPLILHFSVTLGPEWPIHVFTSSSNKNAFQKSSAFARLVKSGAIVLRELPRGIPDDFAFHESYKQSSFLTQKWFWEQIAPAEYVFLFNADSMICSRAEKSLNDFLGYDLVIPQKDTGEDLSGGISLRRRSSMLRVLEESDWNPERSGNAELGGKAKAGAEASWFWSKLEGFAESDSEDVNLPTKELMGSFAMDEVWQEKPFGYVQVQNEHDRLEEITTWCPEYSLAYS